MNIKIKIVCLLFSILFSLTNLFADALERMLKDDFSKQETIKIRFEVNKRLYSFEAGKFKLAKIKKNREKIRSITEKIVPWAIMEHLKPPEVARIIVYMYHADEAGAPFSDAEDLIPLVAQMDVPLKDFVLMVQYNQETKNADIPEEIRHSFLGQSVLKKWDGISILAGGRGLILAKLASLNINKTASLLLKRLPAKGTSVSANKLISIVANIIGSTEKKKNADHIMNNLASAHKLVVSAANSPFGLKTIMQNTSKSNKAIETISAVKIPAATAKNATIDHEKGIIEDLEEIPAVSNTNWQVLDRNALFATIRPWLGIPYKFGAKTGRPGIDCSGFTRVVLIHPNVGVPSSVMGHGTINQRKAGKSVKRKNLRAGDLIFFSASPNKRKITHVGIVTSFGYFTHACSRGVVNDSLNKKWWSQRYVKARRIFAKVQR